MTALSLWYTKLPLNVFHVQVLQGARYTLLPQSHIVRQKIMFSLPWIMLSCITELWILGVDGNSSSLLIQKNIRKVWTSFCWKLTQNFLTTSGHLLTDLTVFQFPFGKICSSVVGWLHLQTIFFPPSYTIQRNEMRFLFYSIAITIALIDT